MALAYNLLNGIGCRADRAAALRWYRKAAHAGHLSAHFSLGQQLTGQEARTYLQFAARRGHARARALLRERTAKARSG
ncbi:MAG: SEL1-like repeat protein [Archangium sp.]|nr:SEL1-like repeat protein [Archangium sp.]